MKLTYGDNAAREVSGRIGTPTATTATMAATPSDRRVDGQLFVVLADYSLWVYEGASVVAASSTVIAPSSGSGRFHRVAVAATS